ncbi:MAG: hypothetical protein JO036_02705 [Candidatus Eremiobacteraeota bacterium]|nr:hypothetical protein [Candidatus Eremiobacteraeota bacterium]
MTVYAYCSSCRRVLDPAGLAVLVPPSVYDEDSHYETARLALASSIGSAGPWRRLYLPAWESIIERRGIDRVQRTTLFEEYSAVSKQKREELVRHHLHLNRGRDVRYLRAPSPFDKVHVNIETVKHLLDEFYHHRQAAGHLRYLPLVARTVEDPFEVWESGKAIYHRGPTWLFLRPYVVATSVINHIVVVAGTTGWVVTTFTHGDADRDRERDGFLRYARY